jgi:hypothetical protein
VVLFPPGTIENGELLNDQEGLLSNANEEHMRAVQAEELGNGVELDLVGVRHAQVKNMLQYKLPQNL